MNVQSAPRGRGDIRDLLVEAANLSVDQMPLLQVIFDRTGQLVADRLKTLSSALPLLTMHDLSTARIGEALDSYDMRAVVGIFQVFGWDTKVFVGFDRDFVYTAVEMLLGGDGSEPPLTEIRNLSNIEVGMSQFVLEQVGTALQTALAPVASTRFRMERAETRMDFAGAGRRSHPAVVARFVLQALNRGGEMFIIIPQSALMPLRQELARFPGRDATPADPSWAHRITESARRTEVTIRAVAESTELTLGDIAAFKVGQVVKLDATTQSRIRVESSEQPLFWAYLGQNEGRYTLCIDEPMEREGDLVASSPAA